MLHAISGADRAAYPELFDQMHQLRARAFHERRGWRVTVENGRERDAFDDLDPLYMMVSDGRGRLLASLRLLPTTGPYMMADVFPEVLPDGGVIRHPLIWESSRFCADTEAVRDFGIDGINQITRELMQGAIRTAYHAGMESIVSVYDIYVERILKRAGLLFERLGPVVRYDEGLRTTSGLIEVSERAMAALELPDGAPRLRLLHAA
ncbi:acyl-homoserine-lactone synthase [Cereibacter sphaeroides]|uniref:acyl-homoserine-lactone synthase n=1 Tax=Cereibacter sphaeroides TaxID=1063 RepID=UPI001F239439|nr:acyl-homoserine-lactone synthase [Cereibacter sphaeroides]MCE6958356.1 acyl-homoserine-lactone synthase [Cereibacter sphaeroides]MCE6972223.1 acyl-homoserine-lactone synthase [Cereibacter sphaeroides]